MVPAVTLLTDFGLQDSYVAQMKGVLLSRGQSVPIVDLVHTIPPQSVWHAAWHLADAVAAFPAGTIHIAVVDPGVGTARRALAAHIGDWLFLAPDNGLLSVVAHQWPVHDVRELTQRQYHRSTVSSVFHGRDVFASVAAHLVDGIRWEDIGPVVSSIDQPWAIPTAVLTHDGIEGVTLLADHFGNLRTSIRLADLQTWQRRNRRGTVLSADSEMLQPNCPPETVLSESVRSVTAAVSPPESRRQSAMPAPGLPLGNASSQLGLPPWDRSGLLDDIVTQDEWGLVEVRWPTFSATPSHPKAVAQGGTMQARCLRCYGLAQPGKLMATLSSAGFLELAVVNGSAVERLGGPEGLPVTWRPSPQSGVPGP
jgi:S-adenosyl-L-methionine hydrolase (adenosine-forming)